MSEETPIWGHTSGLVMGYGPGAEKRNDHRPIGQLDAGSGDALRIAREEGLK